VAWSEVFFKGAPAGSVIERCTTTSTYYARLDGSRRRPAAGRQGPMVMQDEALFLHRHSRRYPNDSASSIDSLTAASPVESAATEQDNQQDDDQERVGVHESGILTEHEVLSLWFRIAGLDNATQPPVRRQGERAAHRAGVIVRLAFGALMFDAGAAVRAVDREQVSSMDNASKARRFTINKWGLASLLLLVGDYLLWGTAFIWKILGVRSGLESPVWSNALSHK
jgi:hypothetical protein